MKLIQRFIKIIPNQKHSKIHFFFSKIIPDSKFIQYISFLPKLSTWAKNHNEYYVVFNNRYQLYDFLNSEIINNGSIDFLEFGVYKGESIRYWSDLNLNLKTKFYGFDSFEGLPHDWKNLRGLEKKYFDLKGNIPIFSDSRISIIKGLFQDTLDFFLKTYDLKNRLVIHIDCDLYSSTLYVLTKLNDKFEPGTILIFDEFSSILSEFRALDDYCTSYLRNYKILGITGYYKQLAIEII